MVHLIANNQTMQANTVHLYLIGHMDMERQKLGLFRENSPKRVKN